MKLVYLGTISTSIVLILGMAMVIPAFILASEEESEQLKVLVQIEIFENENLPFWCDEFKDKLQQNNLRSVVFLTGQIAESYPECIFDFNDVDVGTQGYQYQSILQTHDYLKQLSEIQKGKKILETLGGIESKIYKAPYGITDENIYSLLDRSEILADFSYSNHYNLFLDDQYVKFNFLTIENTSKLDSIDVTKIVTFSFDSLESVNSIFNTIDEIKKHDIQFVNPSDLYGSSLTLRK